MNRGKILKRVFQFLTILTAIGGVVIIYALDKAQEEMEDLQTKVTYATSEVVEVKEEKQPISVLLLGVDEWEDNRRGEDNSRSDTIMVATLNPKEKTTELVTIPRDTLVEIKGKNREGILDKVNHAYAYGGVDQAIATVSNYLDIPIHYYATINMTGLEDLVDAVGGVNVVPSLSFEQSGHSFREGEYVELTGSEALAYARMRKQDPKGDVGRGERQQEIVESIIKKSATAEGILRYREILDTVGDNLKTNAPISLGMIRGYYKVSENINNHLVDNQEGLKVNGVYYLVVQEDKRREMSNVLRANLGLEESKVNHEDYLEDARLGNLRRW